MSTCQWATTVSGSDLDVGCGLEDGHDGPHVDEWDETRLIGDDPSTWQRVPVPDGDHYRVEWTGGYVPTYVSRQP